MHKLLAVTIAAVPFLFCDLAQSQTPFMLDFQENGDTVQSGFTQFEGALVQSPDTQTFGNYTVTVTSQTDRADLGGGFFDRGGLVNSGAFTYANLYNSFAYNNASSSFTSSAATSLTVTISGAAVTPLTNYSMTFFSFDSDAGRPAPTGTHSVNISGLSGTAGTAGITWSDTAPPTSNNQYAGTGIFESDASGTLTFLVADTYNGNLDSRSGVRLNALILDTAVPEPGTLGMITLALAAAAGLWLFRRVRAC